MARRLRIAVVLNASWNIYNFRMGLMERLRGEGYELVAVAPKDAYSVRIPFPFHELPMSPRGRNPLADLVLLWRTLRLYRKLRPDAVLHFTPKPNIYGSLAARLLGIPAISNVAGLGTVFTRDGWFRRCMEAMYRAALRGNRRVFFQNAEDMEYFIGKGLVRRRQAVRVLGSGVDLGKFRPSPRAEDGGEVRFLLVSRLLWEKGVDDFVAAARVLKSRGCGAKFQLLGFLDDKDPASVGRKQVEVWEAEGCVAYLGASDDVRREMASAHCIVLPSRYREGVPRVLLEAAAMGKPIIAYASAGMRDAVEDGRTGYLVPMRDVDALADAMHRMASLDQAERREMGRRGRAKAEREFGEDRVAAAYAEALEGLGRHWAARP